MKKIWKMFCDWIVKKFGGVTSDSFDYWTNIKNQQIKETETKMNNLKEDCNNLYKTNVELLQENTHLYAEKIKTNEYIDKMNKPRKEFVNIGYLSTYPEVYTNDNIEYIVTTGLLEKIRNSGIIKYDYRDGEVVASIEVIK